MPWVFSGISRSLCSHFGAAPCSPHFTPNRFSRHRHLEPPKSINSNQLYRFDSKSVMETRIDYSRWLHLHLLLLRSSQEPRAPAKSFQRERTRRCEKGFSRAKGRLIQRLALLCLPLMRSITSNTKGSLAYRRNPYLHGTNFIFSTVLAISLSAVAAPWLQQDFSTAGETGDSREKMPTSSIDRRDSHKRNIRSDRTENRTRGAAQINIQPLKAQHRNNVHPPQARHRNDTDRHRPSIVATSCRRSGCVLKLVTLERTKFSDFTDRYMTANELQNTAAGPTKKRHPAVAGPALYVSRLSIFASGPIPEYDIEPVSASRSLSASFSRPDYDSYFPCLRGCIASDADLIHLTPLRGRGRLTSNLPLLIWPLLQRYYGHTARLARRSDEALGLRVTVAHIVSLASWPWTLGSNPLLTSRSWELMRLKRGEYGAAPECQSGGNGSSPGKSAEQRSRVARFQGVPAFAGRRVSHEEWKRHIFPSQDQLFTWSHNVLASRGQGEGGSSPAAPTLADQQARPADVRHGARKTHPRCSEEFTITRLAHLDMIQVGLMPPDFKTRGTLYFHKMERHPAIKSFCKNRVFFDTPSLPRDLVDLREQNTGAFAVFTRHMLIRVPTYPDDTATRVECPIAAERKAVSIIEHCGATCRVEHQPIRASRTMHERRTLVLTLDASDTRWQHDLYRRRLASEHLSIVKMQITRVAGGERRTRRAALCSVLVSLHVLMALSAVILLMAIGRQAGKPLVNSWHAPGAIAGPEVASLTSHTLPIAGPGVKKKNILCPLLNYARERKTLRKTRPPAASSGTIPTCENQGVA
ncbi:hypothetical protein PR048_016227 [Dryococelus australis]|uniref:Transmembrane protein n=1 Tax=Dryococelus australis TaxID=614101 RepID=A0ABQ9HJ53_9NEOP|nr:hypothetical protein PR048_016227 [Dryococelus australis]